MSIRLQRPFILAALSLSILLLFPLIAAAQDASPSATTPTPNPAPIGSQTNPQNIGKSVVLGCTKLKIYSAETVEQTGGFMGVYSEENKYLVLDVEVRNECEKERIDFNPFNFFARDTGNGEMYRDSTPTFDYSLDMGAATLEPQRKIRGTIALVIAREARRVVVGYNTDYSGDNIIYFEVNVRLPGQE